MVTDNKIMDTNPETNPLKEGALTENSKGTGTVTIKMMKDRAIEIAWENGRAAHELKPSDYVEASRELTGRPEVIPDEQALENAPESERWDPVPGSTGHKVPVAPGEDEDVEGRSDNEKLTEEGVSGAEDDQARNAAKNEEEKE
ncbi:MAG TPA: hypothetical protein VG347_15855 [Verrucomicrobiae bacterium]|nr:hypothetical protein [Verrucomicrobiae bacterium]